MDRNPFENAMLARLDAGRANARRWSPSVSHRNATDDPRHLAPRRHASASSHGATPRNETPLRNPPLSPKGTVMPTVTARNIKLTLVLDPVQVRAALRPVLNTEGRLPLTVEVEGRRLTMDFAAKAVRKCCSMIEEHGADGVAVLIQGKLMKNDVVAEAGLVAQVKAKKLEEA
jgi:hypothetical protein